MRIHKGEFKADVTALPLALPPRFKAEGTTGSRALKYKSIWLPNAWVVIHRHIIRAAQQLLETGTFMPSFMYAEESAQPLLEAIAG